MQSERMYMKYSDERDLPCELRLVGNRPHYSRYIFTELVVEMKSLSQWMKLAIIAPSLGYLFNTFIVK